MNDDRQACFFLFLLLGNLPPWSPVQTEIVLKETQAQNISESVGTMSMTGPSPIAISSI